MGWVECISVRLYDVLRSEVFHFANLLYYSRTPLIRPPSESHWCGRIKGMVAREGFVYEQKPLSVTRNVVVWEGWSLVRVVVRQGFYCIDIVYLIYKCNYSSFVVRTTSLHHQLKRKQQQQYWRHLPDCLESVPMSYLLLSFNYRKWVVEAEKRLDSIRGIVTSKRMHAWFAVFSTIHSRILLTECASESLYSVRNTAIHRIRLIFDLSNTLVYRLGPNVHFRHSDDAFNVDRVALPQKWSGAKLSTPPLRTPPLRTPIRTDIQGAIQVLRNADGGGGV